MSLAAEGDFRDFVAVRWPDLEAVALLVTLDDDTARRVTTESLQRVHRGWREALDDGRPGELAQRDVLTAAVAAVREVASEGPSVAPAPSAPDCARDDDEGAAPGDLVTDALVDVLRAAAPLERAVLAGRTVWGLEPDEVAGLLGMPSARARDAATGLRAGLARAHAAARGAHGLGPADWAVERDLDEAIAAVLAGQHDPPDPAALVEDLRLSARRRSVVVAGVVLAAAGAASWWAVTERDSAPLSSGSPPASPDPTDPRWNTVAAWPPRGSLAKDPGILAMVAERTSRRGRLLWAGDALGQRIVVASTYGQPYPPGPMLVAWRAPTGASSNALWEDAGPVPEEDAWIRDERDGLAVVLSTGVAEHMRALAVLARPTVTSATYSRMVRPTRAGTVVRLWETLRLAGGVGAVRLAGYAGPAARVRCGGGYDGPVLGVRRQAMLPPTVDDRTGPPSFTDEVRWFVAAVTGLPVETLESAVVVHSAVEGGVIAPRATRGPRRGGRVTVVRTTTERGAVVRSVRVTDDGRSGVGWLDLERASVLPARTPPDEPLVLRLPADGDPGVGRFLVVAPGAARVQLVRPVRAYAESPATPARDGVAVVEVRDPGEASAYRLVRHDAAGRLLGSGVPARGTDLLDLPPQ